MLNFFVDARSILNIGYSINSFGLVGVTCAVANYCFFRSEEFSCPFFNLRHPCDSKPTPFPLLDPLPKEWKPCILYVYIFRSVVYLFHNRKRRTFFYLQVMELDPFWRPQTSEEREDEGEEGHLSVTNIARQYLDGVRKRKGLATNDKIVVAAEKQRTLTRNK